MVMTIALVCLLEARWIPFQKGYPYEAPEVRITASSMLSTSLSTRIFGCEAQVIETDGMINTQNEVFTLLTLPGEYHTGEIGKPRLPVIRRTVEIPHDARIEIEVVSRKHKDVSLASLGINNRIMPVLESVVKRPGERPVFVIDEAQYSKDALYPQEIVTIESEDLMRGHRLAVLTIAPIQYNSLSKTIRYYTDIHIKLHFIGGNREKTREGVQRNHSPLFEDFLRKRILNYYSFAVEDVQPVPIHYLIITHNDFQAHIDTLAHWLKKKGFTVKVANQDSIMDWNPQGIEGYIDAQNPLPSYLLLVGDVNGGYMPAPDGNSSHEVTDLYYAETDGSGYLPDIFCGRLSCETEEHITTEVEKILKYEKADMPAGWYKKAAFLAGHDNYWISEGTHNYCISNFIDPYGYSSYKLYIHTYGATTADVFANVNDGRILTTMSGHGSDDGWWDGPVFTVNHINNLANGDKLTIATGHCCLANNFGSSTNPCGGEAWIRKADGGAVAYYGACPSTFWDEDDWLQREWYEAIYADSLYEHARFTLDGMYDGIYLSSTYAKQYYYEAYHILGDPSLDLWTDAPQNMTVTHDAVVFPGTAHYRVHVLDNGIPISNALVCCWIPDQSPEMHTIAYTDAAGMATLSISPTSPGDTMYVTVTRHNYTPYEGYAVIISQSGPYIVASSLILTDTGHDGQANPGETIDLGVWARNWGNDAAINVYGYLSASDPFASLSISKSKYGRISAGDSSLSKPYYRFSVAENCPNRHTMEFMLQFQDNKDSVWIAYPKVTVFAPVISYQHDTIIDGNSNGLLDPGETVDLVVTILNEGDQTAENTSAHLMTLSPYITIHTDVSSYGLLAPGDSANNMSDPFQIEALSSIPLDTIIDFMMSVHAGVYVDTLYFLLPTGQVGIEENFEDYGIPSQTNLSRVYPNPFSRYLDIQYQVSEPCEISLVVYDATGRLIKSLAQGVCEPGYYTVHWNGCDSAGRAVSAGVYFIRLKGADYEIIKKTILLK